MCSKGVNTEQISKEIFQRACPFHKKKDFKANEITENKRLESFQVCSGLVLENLMGARKVQ